MRDPITHTEIQTNITSSKLNSLRAGVLGANDGIVSVSSVIVGVAGATSEIRAILTAGVAALVAGALSMAVGEYVSVSSQRDSERALLAKEKFELENMPEQELNIDPTNLTNPTHAAFASGVSFILGAIIPVLAILIAPTKYKVIATFASVLIALIVTGTLSAYIGGANKWVATLRVVLGGILAMIITFGIGKLFGVVGI